jgi:hypothetical protein
MFGFIWDRFLVINIRGKLENRFQLGVFLHLKIMLLGDFLSKSTDKFRADGAGTDGRGIKVILKVEECKFLAGN